MIKVQRSKSTTYNFIDLSIGQIFTIYNVNYSNQLYVKIDYGNEKYNTLELQCLNINCENNDNDHPMHLDDYDEVVPIINVVAEYK